MILCACFILFRMCIQYNTYICTQHKHFLQLLCFAWQIRREFLIHTYIHKYSRVYRQLSSFISAIFSTYSHPYIYKYVYTYVCLCSLLAPFKATANGLKATRMRCVVARGDRSLSSWHSKQAKYVCASQQCT